VHFKSQLTKNAFYLMDSQINYVAHTNVVLYHKIIISWLNFATKKKFIFTTTRELTEGVGRGGRRRFEHL